MPALTGRSGRGRRAMNEINMVPFIDVMLVLLIIFMVTAPLITPSMIDLPSVGKAAKLPDQVVQIVIGKDETLELRIQDKASPTSLKDVAAAVKRAQAGANNPAAMAHGISIALYNTAFGLIVAIPALMFYRHFRGRVDDHLMNLELAAERMVPHLMRFAVRPAANGDR